MCSNGHVPGTRLHYQIDAHDCISSVGEDWDAFALANGGGEPILSRHIIGRSLWGFVLGEEVRALYRACLALARTAEGRTQFEFRCDSPEFRRTLTMRIAPGMGGSVVLSTLTMSLTPWPDTGPSAEGPPGPIVMCGLCRAVNVDGWVPVDEWALRYGAESTFRVEQTRYRVCDSCSAIEP